MPQPSTVRKYAPKKKKGFSASRLQAKKGTQDLDVDLGGGEFLRLNCNDLDVGNVRGFQRAADNGDLDIIVPQLLKIATGWETFDDDGNPTPILDDAGEPYPFNEETINRLDIDVFMKIGEAMGKLNFPEPPKS